MKYNFKEKKLLIEIYVLKKRTQNTESSPILHKDGISLLKYLKRYMKMLKLASSAHTHKKTKGKGQRQTEERRKYKR